MHNAAVQRVHDASGIHAHQPGWCLARTPVHEPAL